MTHRSLFSAVAVVVLAVSLVACGDPDENNNTGGNIIPNSTTGNNTSTNNNVTTNNNPTSNNMNTGANNVSTAPDCVALTPALEGECDVLCQSGCMGGQSCTITEQTDASGGEELVTWLSACAAAGAGADGDSCTVNEDCVEGFGCVEEGAGSVCRQYCRTGGPEAPQCPNNLECAPFRTEIRVGTCQEPPEGCTVFPDSCGDGTQCYESPADGSFECVAHGDTRRGDPCDTQSDCQEGLRCADVGGATVCAGICDPSEAEPDLDCFDEESCNTASGPDGELLSWGACY